MARPSIPAPTANSITVSSITTISQSSLSPNLKKLHDPARQVGYSSSFCSVETHKEDFENIYNGRISLNDHDDDSCDPRDKPWAIIATNSANFQVTTDKVDPVYMPTSEISKSTSDVYITVTASSNAINQSVPKSSIIEDICPDSALLSTKVAEEEIDVVNEAPLEIKNASRDTVNRLSNTFNEVPKTAGETLLCPSSLILNYTDCSSNEKTSNKISNEYSPEESRVTELPDSTENNNADTHDIFSNRTLVFLTNDQCSRTIPNFFKNFCEVKRQKQQQVKDISKSFNINDNIARSRNTVDTSRFDSQYSFDKKVTGSQNVELTCVSAPSASLSKLDQFIKEESRKASKPQQIFSVPSTSFNKTKHSKVNVRHNKQEHVSVTKSSGFRDKLSPYSTSGMNACDPNVEARTRFLRAFQGTQFSEADAYTQYQLLNLLAVNSLASNLNLLNGDGIQSTGTSCLQQSSRSSQRQQPTSLSHDNFTSLYNGTSNYSKPSQSVTSAVKSTASSPITLNNLVKVPTYSPSITNAKERKLTPESSKSATKHDSHLKTGGNKDSLLPLQSHTSKTSPFNREEICPNVSTVSLYAQHLQKQPKEYHPKKFKEISPKLQNEANREHNKSNNEKRATELCSANRKISQSKVKKEEQSHNSLLPKGQTEEEAHAIRLLFQNQLECIRKLQQHDLSSLQTGSLDASKNITNNNNLSKKPGMEESHTQATTNHLLHQQALLQLAAASQNHQVSSPFLNFSGAPLTPTPSYTSPSSTAPTSAVTPLPSNVGGAPTSLLVPSPGLVKREFKKERHPSSPGTVSY